MRVLGLRGFELSTAVNDHELSHSSLEPVWAKQQPSLDVWFSFIPWDAPWESGWLHRNSFQQRGAAGRDRRVALSHLIFGGVLDRHTGLKICAAHRRSFCPTYIGRAEHAYRERPDAHTDMAAPPRVLTWRRIWFDSLIYLARGVARSHRPGRGEPGGRRHGLSVRHGPLPDS